MSDGGVSLAVIVKVGITMLTYELMVYHCSKGYCAVLPPELKMLESHYQQQVCFSDGLPGELLSGTERDNVIFRGRVVLEQVLNCARFDGRNAAMHSRRSNSYRSLTCRKERFRFMKAVTFGFIITA